MVEGRGANLLTSCVSNWAFSNEQKAELRRQWNYAMQYSCVRSYHARLQCMDCNFGGSSTNRDSVAGCYAV